MTIEMSNGGKLIALAAVLIGLDYVVLALRWGSRKTKSQRWGIDDILICAAIVPATALAATLIYGCATGLLATHVAYDASGNPIEDARTVASAKIAYAFQLIEVPTLTTVKLSVLFFYRRIFAVGSFLTANTIVIGIVAAWFVVAFLLNLLDCNTNIGANYSYNLDETAAWCANGPNMLLGYLILDVIMDLTILFMPVPMIWGLQLPMVQRIGVSLTFLMGGLAVASALLRMSIYAVVVAGTANGTDPFSDELQFFTLTTTFSLVEITVGIIAACLVTLRPIMMRIFGGGFRSANRSTKRTYDPSLPTSNPLSSGTARSGLRSKVGWSLIDNQVQGEEGKGIMMSTWAQEHGPPAGEPVRVREDEEDLGLPRAL